MQISQNNLSAIFVNEMCRLIQTNLRIKTQKHLKPNNKKCLKRQNHQENLITLNMQNAFTLALTYLYARHVKHTNMLTDTYSVGPTHKNAIFIILKQT